MKPFIKAFLVLVLVLAVTGGTVAYSIASKGLSTRTSPSMAEETIAITLRSLATPRSVRDQPNPVEPTPAMPAWGTGTPEGGRESWALVHVIRRLPDLTATDIERMEGLNPQSPAKFREAEEARLFLEGMTEAPTNSTPAKPHHD